MAKVKRFKLRNLGFYLFLISALSLTLIFQNCAEPPQDGKDVSSVAAVAPFAYDTRINHIAYMSCSGLLGDYDKAAFFSFRAVATEPNHGVKFTSNFVHAVRNLNTGDKVKVLQESPTNANVSAALGIRSPSNLQSVFGSVVGQHVGTFLGPFSQGAVADTLAQVNGAKYTAEFSTGRFATNIHFGTSESLANDVRNLFGSSGNYLALTYNQGGGDIADALGDSGFSQTSAYGYGYKLSFTNDPRYISILTRVLSSVQEDSLVTKTPTGSSWSCNSAWRFTIVHPGDLGRTSCDTTVEPNPTAPADREIYETLRAVLPADQWGVNLTNRCIVPKKAGSCYGGATNFATTTDYDGGTCTASTCPHYLSICKKL